VAQISIAQKDRFLDISTSYTVTTAGPEYKRSLSDFKESFSWIVGI